MRASNLRCTSTKGVLTLWPMVRMYMYIQNSILTQNSLRLGHEFENSKWQCALNFVTIKSKRSHWETTNQHRHYWIYVFCRFVYLSFISWNGLFDSNKQYMSIKISVLYLGRHKKHAHIHIWCFSKWMRQICSVFHHHFVSLSQWHESFDSILY